jgi:hypothetical protein
MRLIKIMVISLALTASAMAAEKDVLSVGHRADQVNGLEELGSLEVAGVGAVRFTARREGKQIVVQVLGPGDKVLGRAESVIGVHETLVYIMSPKGLQKLQVTWAGP